MSIRAFSHQSRNAEIQVVQRLVSRQSILLQSAIQHTFTDTKEDGHTDKESSFKLSHKNPSLFPLPCFPLSQSILPLWPHPRCTPLLTRNTSRTLRSVLHTTLQNSCAATVHWIHGHATAIPFRIPYMYLPSKKSQQYDTTYWEQQNFPPSMLVIKGLWQVLSKVAVASAACINGQFRLYAIQASGKMSIAHLLKNTVFPSEQLYEACVVHPPTGCSTTFSLTHRKTKIRLV